MPATSSSSQDGVTSIQMKYSFMLFERQLRQSPCVLFQFSDTHAILCWAEIKLGVRDSSRVSRSPRVVNHKSRKAERAAVPGEGRAVQGCGL